MCDGQIPQVAAEPEVDANDEEVAPEPEATTEQMTVPQIKQEEEKQGDSGDEGAVSASPA